MSVTRFEPGQLRCRKCFKVEIAVPGECLSMDWPKCCEAPMAVDNEAERLNHPDGAYPQYTGDPKKTITGWKSPGTRLRNTSYGELLNYLQWCQCERDRITAAGTPCEVVWRGTECAVAEVSP